MQAHNPEVSVDVEKIASEHRIVGRRDEIRMTLACISVCRNVLMQGPVGVGKTALARAVTEGINRPWVRVDGDARYTEAKLVGHFDPPGVLERGYLPDLFIPGPLVEAMRSGAVLFINELNRMPEGVQNVLLPALDEGLIHVPHLGTVNAEDGFSVIATQNPMEFVATGHLSEAMLDRFELVPLSYQQETDEVTIVTQEATADPGSDIIEAAVRLVRGTRNDPRIRRGASVRAAVAIADLAAKLDGDIHLAARLALPTRIELQDAQDSPFLDVLKDLEKKTLHSMKAS